MMNRRGQSIIELIVAMAIGVVLIVGGVAAIVPILKITSNVARIQGATSLGKELLDTTRTLAESNWHARDSLSTTSAFQYHTIASTSPFTFASSSESITVGTTTYTRYFYIDDVFRKPTSPFEPGGSAFDASTRKITVVYSWASNASNTIVSYLTRTNDSVLFNTSWTVGGNQSGPVTVTSTNATFATSSNIDYAGTPGSLVITGF